MMTKQMNNHGSRAHAQAVSIYVVSKLAKQSVTAWESELAKLEKDREFMASVYLPLRSAIVMEMRSPGKGRSYLERRILSLSRMRHYETFKAKSLLLFDRFCTFYLPQIELLVENQIAHPGHTETFVFEGQVLKGAVHAIVRLKSGETKLVYFHPSSWNKTQTETFLELLTILAETAYGMSRDQVWFLDFENEQVLKPKKNFVRTRQLILNTAKLYRRFRDAA